MKWFALIAMVLCFAMTTNANGFNHEYPKLSELLSKHVADGLVDYPAVQKDSALLKTFLNEAASVEQEIFAAWNEQERLAFLINLYNAATLQLILEHYPLESIKDIGGLFSGPWKQKVVPLFGERISLDDLEHGIIRSDYHEPRIHFALVCAARGCPPLRFEPYLPTKLDEQLDEQGRRFLLQSPKKNRYDTATKTLFLSPLFKWYRKDFKASAGSLIEYVRKYLPEVEPKAKIRYTTYDWSLNQQ